MPYVEGGELFVRSRLDVYHKNGLSDLLWRYFSAPESEVCLATAVSVNAGIGSGSGRGCFVPQGFPTAA